MPENHKFCPACGTAASSEAAFCLSCGSKFPAIDEEIAASVPVIPQIHR